MDADLGLGRFPRVRLTDATPLHPLPRLSAALGGPAIWMKRDDLTGFAMGGNKARKLEFLIADAQARGADTLVTAGAVQSNHVRQTAAAAAVHGMACRAVVQNVFSSTDRDYLTNGNALLFDLFGASIVTAPTDADLDAALAREVEAVRAAGGRPCAVPVGGSSAIGALGYVVAAQEIAAQARSAGVWFDVVVLASGSAGTQAGLICGLRRLLPQTRVVGVSVSRGREAQEAKVRALANEVEALLPDGRPLEDGEASVWDEYFAPSYGVPNAAGLAAIREVARREGVALDPVYTGKAMAGLIDRVRAGRLGEVRTALFLHTGGAVADFAYAGALRAQ
jgi:D-cysteine desulfhydrase